MVDKLLEHFEELKAKVESGHGFRITMTPMELDQNGQSVACSDGFKV